MTRLFSAILFGGVVAGTLDIIYAIIVFGPLSYGLSPLQVLQSVANGWIGREAARAGGWETGLLGLGTHFLIALAMAAVFVLAAQRLRALTARPVLWGVAYGLMLYMVMYYVVVPLSAAGTGHFPGDLAEASARLQKAFSAVRPGDPMMLAGTILTHTLLVGVPIALIAGRFRRS